MKRAFKIFTGLILSLVLVIGSPIASAFAATTPQQLIEKGNQEYSSKQYEEAIDTMDRALELKPNFDEIADASIVKARSYAKLGYASFALKSLRKALEFKETLVNSVEQDSDLDGLKSDSEFKALVLLYKGILQNYDGNFKTGFDYIEQAINEGPDFYKYFVALNSKANALSGLEKYDEAIALFQEAIGYAADDFDKYTAFKNIGFNFSNQEKYQNALLPLTLAVQYYDEAEREALPIPDRTDLAPVWETQGWAFISLERYDEAIESFDKAVESDSNDAWAIYGKATSLAALDKGDSALENLKLAVDNEPKVAEDANNDLEWESLRSDSRFKAIVGS